MRDWNVVSFAVTIAGIPTVSGWGHSAVALGLWEISRALKPLNMDVSKLPRVPTVSLVALLIFGKIMSLDDLIVARRPKA